MPCTFTFLLLSFDFSMVFRTKRIKQNLTIGQRLKAARERQNITLVQAQEQTLIRGKYLQALEQDNWLILPGRAYLKGYLRRYSDFLELDGNTLVNQFTKEFTHWTTTSPASPSLEPLKRHWSVTPKLLATLLAAVIILAMVGYIGYQIRQISAPPTLVIIAPAKEVILAQERLEIVGRSSAGSVVLINNQNVMQDASGNFRLEISLQDGLNTIEIVAKSRFNRVTSKTIKVLRPSPITNQS